jgi:hypothetical protein
VGFVQGLCIASSAEVIVRNADFFVEMDIREILIANFSLPTFVVFKDTEWLFFAQPGTDSGFVLRQLQATPSVFGKSVSRTSGYEQPFAIGNEKSLALIKSLALKSLALIGSDSARARGLWPKQNGDGPRHCR